MNILTQVVAMLTQLLSRPRQVKAVPPQKFHPDRDQDLDMFFKEFEEYCRILYPNQPQDWVRLLGNFLEGSYLDLYLQVRKSNTTYEMMKYQFTIWYQQEAQIRKEKAVKNFMLIQMSTTESVRVFAYRLLDLARKAYPGLTDSQLMEHETVRITFLNALPSQVRTQMESFLYNKEYSDGRRVHFNQLVSWADRHYHDLRVAGQLPVAPETAGISLVTATDATPPQKTWADVVQQYKPINATPASPKSNQQQQSKKKTTNQQRRRNQSNSSQNSPKRTSQNNRSRNYDTKSNVYCSFCDKTNHSLDKCYVFNNICSNCKQKGHMSYSCTRERNNNGEQSKVTCPVCKQKGHSGKNCADWRKNHPNPFRQRERTRSSSGDSVKSSGSGKGGKRSSTGESSQSEK